MEIKIVGGVSDIDDVHNIENVAKMFVIEHRINNLSLFRETQNIIQESSQKSAKETITSVNSIKRNLAVLTVRGLK